VFDGGFGGKLFFGRFMECHEQDTSTRPASLASFAATRPLECLEQQLSLADQIRTIGRAMTAKELAKFLNVSPITVFKQAKAGRIPSFRIGTCVRFDPQAVARWLKSSSQFSS
jgi:excisionase family DNA binding protein